jgi:hypothetical protein
MVPWEREVYVTLLTKYIKEKKKKRQREAQK